MSSPDRPHRIAGARAALLALAALGGVAGCGFQPLYGSGAAAPGSIAEETGVTRTLARIEVATIPDRAGQMLRTELVDRLSPGGRPRDPLYRLDVALSSSTQELGIERDEVATRANLRVVGQYRLIRKEDGQEMTSGRLTTLTSYNILPDPVVTITAERDAEARALSRLADNLRTQLSLYFTRSPTD